LLGKNKTCDQTRNCNEGKRFYAYIITLAKNFTAFIRRFDTLPEKAAHKPERLSNADKKLVYLF
jgi:hypothetical protein